MFNSNQNYAYHNAFNSYQNRYPNRPKNEAECQNNWCETCDRGFYTKLLLGQHISEHQKCGIDGCKFVAHPNIVTKHIQMQHSTGLYNRIRNIETPEDIQKWISERKKKYPSKVNIEIKKSQQEECIDRGEKLQDKKSRFNRKEKRPNNKSNHPRFTNDKKRVINRTEKRKPYNNNLTIKNTKTPDLQNAEDEIYCGVKPFKGIGKIIREESVEEDEPVLCNDNIEIEDDEWKDITENTSNVTLCRALSSLVDAYKSSSEDENETILPIKIDREIPKEDHSVIKDLINNDSDNGPDEVAIIRKDSSTDITNADSNANANDSSINPVNKRIRRRKRKLDTNDPDDDKPQTNGLAEAKINVRPLNTFERQLQYYKDRPSTLLEKLLEKEMRHERNIILQCINYIVKKDFFETNQ